jgi:hypothetical protein
VRTQSPVNIVECVGKKERNEGTCSIGNNLKRGQ